MKLKSGEAVVERFNRHAHSGISEDLLKEALGRIEAQGRLFIEAQVDFDSIVGTTICVATGPGDEIVYTQRPRRFGLTRFVKNRRPEPCRSIFAVLKAAEPDAYVLITAFVGTKPEPEPWDTKYFSQQPDPAEAERRSRTFWARHALVWGKEAVIPGTETTMCPW